ncbi:hypothetical protein KF913_09480 [Candidatus Obscuribacterales bacterium]|nr:hypothetical protein [Candidatus Obscuribacterales bacterium]
MKSKDKSTAISILLGFAALAGSFVLIMSDPSQGGKIMQQVQQSAADLAKPPAPTAPPMSSTPSMPTDSMQTLAPEGRLDGNTMPMRVNMPMLPSGSGAQSSSGGGTSLSSAEAYLDSAWNTPQANSQSNTMQRMQAPPQPSRFPAGGQRGFSSHGFGQRGFSQQGFQPRGFGQGFPQQMQPGIQQPGAPTSNKLSEMMSQMNSSQDSSAVSSARDAVNYELSYARSQASQAASCMQRARNAGDDSERESAASEARSHAASAMAAAGRAASRAGGMPELNGLVSQIRNVANQAQSSAQSAASAAGRW